MHAAVYGGSGGAWARAVFGVMNDCRLNPSDNLHILYLVSSFGFSSLELNRIVVLTPVEGKGGENKYFYGTFCQS